MAGIALILIDDEELIRAAWDAEATTRGQRLLAVATPGDLEDYDLDLDIPIYVDINLGDGVSGIDAAKRLDALGFRQIYLATGSRVVKPDGVPSFIKGVTGKEYPLAGI